MIAPSAFGTKTGAARLTDFVGPGGGAGAGTSGGLRISTSTRRGNMDGRFSGSIAFHILGLVIRYLDS